MAILHYDTIHPGAMGLWRPEMINLVPLLEGTASALPPRSRSA